MSVGIWKSHSMQIVISHKIKTCVYFRQMLILVLKSNLLHARSVCRPDFESKVCVEFRTNIFSSSR